MTPQECLREAAGLRFRLQMNNRLRLESLAALSKVFRDFGEPIQDELLSSIVFAVPQELLVEYSAAGKASKSGKKLRPQIPNGATKKRPPPAGTKKASKKSKKK